MGEHGTSHNAKLINMQHKATDEHLHILLSAGSRLKVAVAGLEEEKFARAMVLELEY